MINRLAGLLRLSSLSVLLGSAVGGCDALSGLLDVEAPSRVVADDLENPAAAGLLVASVANEFRCMLTHYATASALTGNEWRDASNNSVLNIWDQRVHDTSGYGAQYATTDCGGNQPAVYQPLSRTRWLADQTLDLLAGWDVADVPDKAAYEVEVAMYAGFTYTIFGEAMCSVAFDDGPEQMPADVFQLAIERFDQAIAAGATGDMLNAALVGKARAQLNLNQKTAAATTARAVAPGFSFSLDYSGAEDVTRNKQWEFNTDDENVTVAEPYRDVSYGGVSDPRISVVDAGVTNPQTDIAIWTSSKYPDAASPVEVASWEEAQLIIAEAEIEAGNFAAAVAIFDALHTAVGLPPYSGGLNTVELMDQLVYERAAEMYLEGHHLQDLKRLNIPLFPSPGTDDGFGGAYGDQICFDLPATEFQNNTSLTGP